MRLFATLSTALVCIFVSVPALAASSQSYPRLSGTGSNILTHQRRRDVYANHIQPMQALSKRSLRMPATKRYDWENYHNGKSTLAVREIKDDPEYQKALKEHEAAMKKYESDLEKYGKDVKKYTQGVQNQNVEAQKWKELQDGVLRVHDYIQTLPPSKQSLSDRLFDMPPSPARKIPDRVQVEGFAAAMSSGFKNAPPKPPLRPKTPTPPVRL